jgi:hypothetical protein
MNKFKKYLLAVLPTMLIGSTPLSISSMRYFSRRKLKSSIVVCSTESGKKFHETEKISPCTDPFSSFGSHQVSQKITNHPAQNVIHFLKENHLLSTNNEQKSCISGETSLLHGRKDFAHDNFYDHCHLSPNFTYNTHTYHNDLFTRCKPNYGYVWHPKTLVKPTISIADENLSYTEGTSAIQIAPNAAVSDANGYTIWDGEKLEIQITANNEPGDQLSIPDNLVDNINTSGTDLRDNTTVFGTLSASEGTVTNSSKLTITFNSNATHERVSKAAQAVHYENTSVNPGTSNRTITFTVIDNMNGYTSDTRTIEVSQVAAPSTQASAISFTGVSKNQMTINWSDGNGLKRAVFIKQASSGTCAPSENTTYTANTVFGSGAQVGSTGWYCVFNSDTGSSVTVTGLDAGTTYRVHICEYNGSEGFENYNTDAGASNNPNNQETQPVISGLWTGITDTDWAKGTNWDDGTVPGSAISITIPDVSNQPVLDQSRIIKDLTLQSNAALTIDEAYTLTASNLEIDDSAVIDITTNGGILVITGIYNKVGTGRIDAANGGVANIKGNILKDGALRLIVDPASDGVLIRSGIILE